MSGFSTYLMETPVLTVMLLCHFLSDFHLQSPKMAQYKETNRLYLIRHLFWVAIPLFLSFLLQIKIWWLVLVIFLSHALIDYLKPYLRRSLRLSPTYSFILDQTLHMIVICALIPFYRGLSLPAWLPHSFINILLFVTLISKPTNIAFRIVFQDFQPVDAAKMDTIAGAGATIGFLERLVIGICIALGQFASIGLVFTAKSIARYNKISESPTFAEYYLIGSLFSILSALFAAWICFL